MFQAQTGLISTNFPHSLYIYLFSSKRAFDAVKAEIKEDYERTLSERALLHACAKQDAILKSTMKGK